MKYWLVAATLIAAAPAAAQNVALELAKGETLLEVEAEGIHLSTPDIVEISAGVVTTGTSAAEALSTNSALANGMADAIRSLGVAPADIRTSRLRVEPRFERDQDDNLASLAPRIIGYVATNEMSVRIRDLSKASSLLDALIEAGANNVSGPIFSLSDDAVAIGSARQKAVDKARIEAEDYANALGLRIDRVLRLSERNQMTSSGVFHLGELARREPVGAPIEPGQIETEVTVWIDYALVPK